MALFARGHVTRGRRPHVPHVNTRALRFFETFETSKQVDIDQLFAGMSVTRRDLTGPQRWISWDDFAEIYDRFVRTLGPAALEAAGEQIIAPAYLGPFLKILGIFTDPIDLYRVGLRWFAPTMYRSLSFTITQVGAGRLEIVVEIPSAHRPSEAFLRSATGGFRALPRALGSADASVEATITGRRGRYLVTVPPAKRVTATLRRALAALRGADAVIDELADQQAKIAASHEALVATELGFHSALEALPVGVGVQREGRWLYVNSAMAGLVGVRPAELLGHPVLDLVDEHDRPRVQALMSVASLETAEVRLALGDTETYVECGATGGMVFNGEPAELFFAIDLTARRAAQRAAARSEGITKAFLDVLPDLVLRIDRSGVLHEFRAGRGHPDVASLQPFLGTSVVLVAEALSGVAKSVIEGGLARLRESLDTRRELTVQVTDLPMQVGHHYDCRIIPESEDEALVLVRDVTEQRKLEQQLAVTERMATLGMVAASVAHELNNPLTFVVGNISLALEAIEAGRLDAAALRQSLTEALEGAGRVRTIVSELQVFSRASAREDRQATNVLSVLDSALAMTRSAVREKARVVRVVEAVVPVDIESSRLGQVLVNLIMNAAQATPEGAPERHEIRIVASVGADGWQRLTVSDDGPGVPEEARGRIFEPFVTTKSASGGTGLGLAICHRIVTERGGTIRVAEGQRPGATFEVRLPPSEQAPRRSAPGSSMPAPEGVVPARILVVDDEPLVARAVLRILERHQPVWVATAELAIERLAAERFDLVLCDLMLGGKTGLDVRAAAGPEQRDRFLFITGGALTESARDLLASEPERFVTKPFTPVELRRRVDAALLARRRPASPRE
ncbi:MAG: PAS domain-containing protein [Polyangiaceae bacterium]|nr:PAS domain-containing protein [Polyangiaceae bacterium]